MSKIADESVSAPIPASAPAPADSVPTTLRGNLILARALARRGVDTIFFLMGGPMTEAEGLCAKEGIHMIDVRHEQAAAMAAQAYARLLAKPGVCMACSGPGMINLTTGVANALIDAVPLVAIGGASPLGQFAMGAFQEIDQVAIMRPVTKWAERVYDTRRIPEYVEMAFNEAVAGKPGPVYLDIPGDVLYRDVEESEIKWPPQKQRFVAKPAAGPEAIERVLAMVREAQRPLVLSGTGIIWSGASAELQRFVDRTGSPFYTTPQGRGVIPEDHPYFYGSARTTAMKEADLVLVFGTRLNYVSGFGRPPRFSSSAKFVRVDIDPEEISGSQNLDCGIVGDAKTVLAQINAALEGNELVERFAPWRTRLGEIEAERRPEAERKLANDATPIHPLRLCKEIRDFIDRDAVLIVDGLDILNYGRQAIPSYVPGHRMNSGPFGTMGVGMPFGVGSAVAKPGTQVVVLHGDGSFGLNLMELDTAVRHNLPMLVVISLNGGWTADPGGTKQGRNLGYTRYDKIAENLGCYGEFVERPEDIRPALERAGKAVRDGRVALVNVVTDFRARAQTRQFTSYREASGKK